MAERGTLRLDTGRELRVEVVTTDADAGEMVVREMRADRAEPPSDLLAIIDAHLATATPHTAGTTDQLLAADRDRLY